MYKKPYNKDIQERIDKAIDMKNRQIAYFNSVNAAIELIKDAVVGRLGDKETEKEIIGWRDWFYKEWQNWYLKETTPQPLTEAGIKRGKDEWETKREQDRQEGDAIIQEGIEATNLELGQEENPAETTQERLYEENQRNNQSNQ